MGSCFSHLSLLNFSPVTLQHCCEICRDSAGVSELLAGGMVYTGGLGHGAFSSSLASVSRP